MSKAHITLDVGDGPLVVDVLCPGRNLSLFVNELELRMDADCAIYLDRALTEARDKVRAYIDAVSRQTAIGSDLGWKDGAPA